MGVANTRQLRDLGGFGGVRPGGRGPWGCSLYPRCGAACHGSIELCSECWRAVKDASEGAGMGAAHTRTAGMSQHGNAWLVLVEQKDKDIDEC